MFWGKRTSGWNTNLGDSLGLVRLLGLVSSDTLSLDPLSLSILLIVRAEEVDIVFIFSSSRGGSRSRATSTTEELGGSFLVTRESGVLGFPRLDVLVPTGGVGVLGGRGSGAKGGVYTNISLRGLVAVFSVSIVPISEGGVLIGNKG